MGPEKNDMSIVLKLYIFKSQPSSEQIVKKLTEMFDGSVKGRFALKVIDIEEDPEQAERDNILAAPALVRVHPKPVKKVIGDLSNRAHLFAALDLPLK
jgi:circadian clock protein KaiB